MEVTGNSLLWSLPLSSKHRLKWGVALAFTKPRLCEVVANNGSNSFRLGLFCSVLGTCRDPYISVNSNSGLAEDAQTRKGLSTSP